MLTIKQKLRIQLEKNIVKTKGKILSFYERKKRRPDNQQHHGRQYGRTRRPSSQGRRHQRRFHRPAELGKEPSPARTNNILRGKKKPSAIRNRAIKEHNLIIFHVITAN